MSELTEIPGIAGATASTLQTELGISTPEDLAQANPEEVDDAVSHLNGQKVVREAGKRTITIQTGDEVATEMDNKEYLTTGIGGFDDILDGGWEEGTLAGIYGLSGQGKTQIVKQSMVSGVESTERPALYIETEDDNYRPDRLKALSNDKSTQGNVYKIGDVNTVEDQYTAYEAVLDNFSKGDLSVIVIDSFNTHFRGEYSGRNELGERSDEMKSHISKLRTVAKELAVPVLMNLQVYSSPEAYGKTDNIYGGNILLHQLNYFVRMSNGTGELKQATLENHPGLPEKTILLSIGENSIEYVGTP